MPSSLNAHLRSFLFRFSYKLQPNPTRDWAVLLSFAGLILALIVVWNVWAFETVVNGGTLGSAATSTQPVFSQTSLDTIQNLLMSRAAEDTKYTNGDYRFTDPSL